MVEVVNELRIADGGRGEGNLLFAVRLPAGERWPWDPPSASSQMPDGLGEVELYLDGVLAERGVWPNLIPVDAP